MAKLKRRRRKPGEVVTRKQAIRNMCLECMCYQIAEVHRCTAHKCWLWPYRLGAVDDEGLNEEKQEAKEVKDGQTGTKTKIRKKSIHSKSTKGNN